MNCPPGTQERTCSGGSWGEWGSCQADTTDFRFYGDGGTRCGPVVCIQVSPIGNNSTVTATITKANTGVFDNDIAVDFGWSDGSTSSQPCASTQGKASASFQLTRPSGLDLGETFILKATITSPCTGANTYDTDDGFVSRCKS